MQRKLMWVALMFIIVGAVLLITEAMSPGVFMLIPGTVLVILGIIGLIVPDFIFSLWSPVIALCIAVPVTVGTVLMYRSLAKPEPPTTTVTESLVGKEGTVTVATDPNNILGKVKIGSDVWSATSDEPLDAGTPVTVVKSQGVHVTVAKK
jgi:membrane protein implicated in regulation of membrane protease activity